jgi:hypothetical protein
MNVKFEKGEIVIRIPFKKDGAYPLSKSGKSRLVATTGGFSAVDGAPDQSMRVAVNLIVGIPA